jgi:hypothetical protein
VAVVALQELVQAQLVPAPGVARGRAIVLDYYR